MKSVIHLRISDNVLKDEDWPIVEATMVNSHIVELKEIQRGAYVWRNSVFIGMRIDTLLKWLKHAEPTDAHPEYYCQIRLLPNGKWENVYTMEKLKVLLELAAV